LSIFAAMVNVIFVCLGNICRSPLAEGVFRKLAIDAGVDEELHIDSMATSTYEIGNDPDPRTLKNAKEHGLELSHKAKQITKVDFLRANYVLAMDHKNIEALHSLLKLGDQAVTKLYLLRDFDPKGPGEIADPYFGDEALFESTYQLIHQSCQGLLAEVIEEYKLISKNQL
jgi:protein-tyrosine phosphatase